MSEDAEDDGKAISAIMAALKPLQPESRVHVLSFVVKRLGISLDAPPAQPPEGHFTPGGGAPSLNTPPPGAPGAPASLARDIRSFANEKKPRTVNEKVAVIGYYLAHLAPESERRDYLTSDDIKTYFIQADFELPTAEPRVTLGNAKNAGYLNALDRGRFKLNAVGHNLVAHKLPGGEVGESRAARKPANTKKARPKARR